MLIDPLLVFHRERAIELFSPGSRAVLVDALGNKSLWNVGAVGAPRKLSKMVNTAQALTAIALPEELFLTKTLSFSYINSEELHGAIELEVNASSPFGPNDLTWGWRLVKSENGIHQIAVVLASRNQIDQFLSGVEQRVGIRPSEVWAFVRPEEPVVLADYGREARESRRSNARAIGYALTAIMLILAVLLSVSPTVQLSLRAKEATFAFDSLNRATKDLQEQKNVYLQQVEKLDFLNTLIHSGVDPLWVMERITNVLPDDTSLLALQVNGGKVSMSGQTGNAATLMKIIGSQDGMRDVKAPTPAARPLGAAKDNFAIEFSMDVRPSIAAPMVATVARPAEQAGPIHQAVSSQSVGTSSR